MKNPEKWLPTKYVFKGKQLRANGDPRHVSPASFLAADLVARSFGDHIPRHCKGRLLDLGCGHVPLYEAYASYMEENICSDWPNSIHHNPFLDTFTDLTQALPFPPEAFDTIILSDVLEHIPNPEALWKEMGRILKKDGKLLLSVPFFYWIHEAPWDYFRYTHFALERFAEQSGFKVILLEPSGGLPEIAADVLAKLLMHLPILGRPMGSLLQRICLRAFRSGPGKRLSQRTSRYYPLGYFGVFQKV